MFAADARNVVVSEAASIDSIVQLAASRTDVPIEQRIELLRMIVGALGRDRLDGAGHYVVKLDSWHTLALPLFRLAFPDTPWIFLYRDPVEILVSHARMAGAQTVPGAMPFEPYGIENAAEMHPDDYAARALGRTAEAVIEHFGLGGGMLVNYTELPDAVEARILPHFGIVPDDWQWRRWRPPPAVTPRRRANVSPGTARGSSRRRTRRSAPMPCSIWTSLYRRLEERRRTGEKMSAIFGILRFDGEPASSREMDRMSRTLAHHGPDGRRTALDGPVALGHCLLRVNQEGSGSRRSRFWTAS